MIVVSVMYPATADATFDMQYYLEKHVPLVGQRWSAMGLQEAKVLKGVSAADGGAATYSVVALLTFESTDALQRALELHGREIVGDIANFTNVTPVIQVNDVLV